MGVYRYEIKIWGCSILQPDLDNCLFALQVHKRIQAIMSAKYVMGGRLSLH